MLNEQLNDLYRNNLGDLMEMYSVLDGQKIFHYVGPLWRKRSIPTHSEWLYPLTFDAGKGLKEA